MTGIMKYQPIKKHQKYTTKDMRNIIYMKEIECRHWREIDDNLQREYGSCKSKYKQMKRDGKLERYRNYIQKNVSPPPARIVTETNNKEIIKDILTQIHTLEVKVISLL